MVAYHYSNVDLVAPFKTRKYYHILAAYNSIMQRLNNRGLTTHLQFLDNEAIQDYKATIKDKWDVEFPTGDSQYSQKKCIRTSNHYFQGAFLSCPVGGDT